MRTFVGRILDAQQDMRLVAEAADYAEGRDRLTPGTVDVVVMDVDLGTGNGIALATAVQRADPHVAILLLSAQDVLDLVLAARAGNARPWSYLSKKSSLDAATLVRAVRGAARGDVVIDPELVERAQTRAGTPLAGLTAGQVKVLRLAAEGFSNAYIAESLGISPRSVENHLYAIYRALDVPADTMNPRVAAVLAYVQQTSRY
ncbi:response regulator transcription factor [Cellulomonas fimi]|nr:response regulator transcription factor [Cellulomonas fimi]